MRTCPAIAVTGPRIAAATEGRERRQGQRVRKNLSCFHLRGSSYIFHSHYNAVFSCCVVVAMPIPQGTCWLIEQLLIEDPNTKVFTHHRVISYLLGFLDSTAYIRFRQCSKLLCRAVEMDLNKRLYRLPFQFHPEKTDIGYCKEIALFSFSSGELAGLGAVLLMIRLCVFWE